MSQESVPPKLVVVTAPSGAGKTSIARGLLTQVPELSFSVSACTRKKRDYETDGVHYHFISPEQFDNYIQEEAFIEWEEVYAGRRYGTLKSEVERISSNGNTLLLDIDVKGANKVKQTYGEAAFVIFIKPPDLQTLKDRLSGRGSETEADLKIRLDKSVEELSYADRFDAIVVNEQLEEATLEAKSLVENFLKKQIGKTINQMPS